MFGVLNLIKPVGLTSRDAVNRVQRLVRPHKVGHAGTLDPLASGVLVVCVGPATRLIEYVQRMPKEYSATFMLGRRSPSDDLETEVELQRGATRPSRSEIEAVLPRFVGRIQQTPPVYSAAKINGRRAYRLARQGRPVEIAPRTVRIDSLQITRYDYPELQMQVRCGGGTYVRSLGVDVAAELGTVAVMSGLVRGAVGQFHFDHALAIDRLDAGSLRQALLSPLTAVAELPRIVLVSAQIEEVRHGRPIERIVAPPAHLHVGVEYAGRALPGERVSPCDVAAEEIVAIDQTGNVVALLSEKESDVLAPTKVFPEAV